MAGTCLPAYGVLNVAPDTTYNMPATAYRPTVVSAPMTLRSATRERSSSFIP